MSGLELKSVHDLIELSKSVGWQVEEIDHGYLCLCQDLSQEKSYRTFVWKHSFVGDVDKAIREFDREGRTQAMIEGLQGDASELVKAQLISAEKMLKEVYSQITASFTKEFIGFMKTQGWLVKEVDTDCHIFGHSPQGIEMGFRVRTAHFVADLRTYADRFDPDNFIAMFMKRNGGKSEFTPRMLMTEAEEMKEKLEQLAVEVGFHLMALCDDFE